MIDIPGDYLEGGGQILRTALALSCVTNRPFRVYNVRGKRSNPGLRNQHLCAFKTCKSISSAEAKGLNLGSREVIFKPKKVKSGKFKADIGTAGGIGLLLQSVLLPACFASDKISLDITGGTCGRAQIPMEYYEGVIIPILKKMGVDIKLKLLKAGYYPKGGGRVEVSIKPVKGLNRLNLLETGKIIKIYGISHASKFLSKSKVAERQKDAGIEILSKSLDVPIQIDFEYREALCPGSGIVIWAESDKGAILGADALGEKGKPAEQVGEEAAKKLRDELDTEAPVDKHLADNLIPWLAIAGGAIKVSEITLHTRTNIWVSELFFGKKFKIDKNLIRIDKDFYNRGL